MRILLTLLLLAGMVYRTAAQTFTVAGLRVFAAPDTSVIYQTTDYGGGLWNYSSDTTTIDNTGTILVSTATGGTYKRIYDGALNIRWFGAKGDGVTNDIPAWDLAKAALPAGGGTIYFPRGRYMSDAVGWRVFRSNVYMKGDGIDATFLLTPRPSSAYGLQLARYRDGGWSLNPATLYTYMDTAAVGQGYIRLKPGQDKTLLKKDMVLFFNGGANYYDQFYGEFNVIDTLIGDQLFFKYNFARDYTAARSSWNGTLTAPFTPPAINASAIAQIESPPPMNANQAISLGNDLYQVTASSGNNVTLRNLGKGNGTAVIPAGTRVYKARAIYLTPSTVYNIIVEDMSIDGQRNGLVVSNSVKSYFNRIRLTSRKGVIPGGLWLDGDGGRDMILDNSEIYSDGVRNSQMARSFGDIKFKNTKFFQSTVDFSEFNYNFDVEDCDIHLHKIDAEPLGYAISVGTSTTNGRIFKNRISISDATSVITANDIQGYRASSRSAMVISNNIIYADRCVSGISLHTAGTLAIEDNTIIGNIVNIFGSSAALPYGASNQVVENQRFVFGSAMTIRRNTFVGYTDNFTVRPDPFNIDVQDNYVNRFGPSWKPDLNAAGLGNIIRGSVSSPTPTLTVPAENLTVRNNVFKGWNYSQFSFNLQRPLNDRVDISNNRFFDQTGTYRADKDFVISIRDENALAYGDIRYLPLQKNQELDWKAYTSLVKNLGGKLQSIDSLSGKELLSDIYSNNLRDKVEMINPLLGDAAASRIPLLGWEKSMYRYFASKTFTDADYTKNTGWKGDGISKYGIIGQVGDFDYKDFGLFVNLTAAGTTPLETYIGGYSSDNAAYCLRKNGSVLTGLGMAAIDSNYVGQPGFIFSGQATGRQLNYIDMSSQPARVSTELRNQLVTRSQLNLALLAQAAVQLPNTKYFSSAAVGCYGVTKYLSLPEVQKLNQLIYKTMVALGRSVQANPDNTPVDDNEPAIH
jgi:hypothetical protein